MRIIGYGICGQGEADRYLKDTLDCFKSLCDDTIILLNNVSDKERELISSYGFKTVEDNREWGLNQHRIKQEFMKEVEKLNPDWCVCLDMDEVLDITKEEIKTYMQKCRSYYVYIVNLIDNGWSRKKSFWNVRFWKWDKDVLNYFGEEFYRFENKPLHCGLAPRWAYLHGSYAPIILLHSGLKDYKDRQRKIERYNKYDPDAKYKDEAYYKFLASPDIDTLDLGFIKNEIKKELDNVSYKDRPIRSVQTGIKKAFCYFRRKKDGVVIDVPEEAYEEMRHRDGFEELYWVGDRKK